MTTPLKGRCQCNHVQFELRQPPLFVHACHCLHCKRKTGSSFGLTCIVLEKDIEIITGEITTKMDSPRTTAYHCTECGKVIYRTNTQFKATAWLQTNCLEDSRLLHIGAHIWVKRKDPWLALPEGIPQFDEGYHRDGVWPEASIQRVDRQVQVMENPK